MRDLSKLFKQKTSVEFRYRPYHARGLGLKEVLIQGDHDVHSQALSPQTVLRFILGGEAAMRAYAAEAGYTGLSEVDFYVEAGTTWVSVSIQDYDDASYDAEVFWLVARNRP